MILVTHALVGATIGKNINNPLIIIPVTLATHFVLDSFRHGEYLDKTSTFRNTWWKVALDLFAGLLLVSFYVMSKDLNFIKIRNIFIGSFSSMFPDFLTLLYWIYPVAFLRKIHDLHEWVHGCFFPQKLTWSIKNARNDLLLSAIAIIFLFI